MSIDPNMPQRPRSHQLESESRAAIRSAIPPVWVYRDLDQDYGVDSEVEIFAENGSATGIKFLVQLKGTDEPILHKALRLRFPQAKFEYYKSLDLPVLIVRYHAHSKHLYVRWFHRLRPDNEKRRYSSFSFLLAEEDVWDNTTPPRLITEIEAYREIKSPRISKTLRFLLKVDDEEIHGIPAYDLRLKLREAANEVSHIISIQTEPSVGATYPHAISITNSKIDIEVGGFHGFTLHTPYSYAAGDAKESMHHDNLLGIGLALDQRGHPIEAAEVIACFWRSSYLVREIATAMPMAFCLARANQIHLALEIAEDFFNDESTIEAAQIFLFPFFLRQVGKRIAEREFALKIIDRIARHLEHGGDSAQAAILHYNCANVLREMRRFREAIRHYRNAGRLDSAYLGRSYYWRELAGVLFESRQYILAAKLYERSIEIDKDHRLTRFLYADSLFFSGRYSEAEQIFDEFLESPAPPDDAEWALKKFAAGLLREGLGVDEQHRKIPTFPVSFDPRSLEDSETERICEQALDEDALSALAWYNLGGVRLRSGDNDNAAKCFLMAALIVPRDLEAWGNVIALASKTEDVSLYGHAFVACYQINGDEALRHLARRVPAEQRDEVIGLWTETIRQASSLSKSTTSIGTLAPADWYEFIMRPDGKVELKSSFGENLIRSHS